jgi:hypothetical protein
MVVPPLTPEQRQAALVKATEARKARSELLAAVKAGQTSVAEVLGRGDDVARRAKVMQLLRAVPGCGPAKAAELMAICGVSETRRVGGLGDKQRRKLVALLRPSR